MAYKRQIIVLVRERGKASKLKKKKKTRIKTKEQNQKAKSKRLKRENAKRYKAKSNKQKCKKPKRPYSQKLNRTTTTPRAGVPLHEHTLPCGPRTRKKRQQSERQRRETDFQTLESRQTKQGTK